MLDRKDPSPDYHFGLVSATVWAFKFRERRMVAGCACSGTALDFAFERRGSCLASRPLSLSLRLAGHSPRLTMGGPNLEVFKFSVYVFFPVVMLLYYGNPDWYARNVLPVCMRRLQT